MENRTKPLWPYALALAAMMTVMVAFTWFHVREDQGREWSTGNTHVYLALAGLNLLGLALAGLMLYERQRRQLLARLQSAAQASDQRFRHLVEGLDAIVWEAEVVPAAPERAPRIPLKLTFVSRRAEKVLGHPVERWLEEPGLIGRVIHREDQPKLAAVLTSALAEKEDFDLEHRAFTADGNEVWLREIVRIVQNGAPAPTLRGLTIDVSARRQMEQALRESEERFRLTVQSATIGIAMIDLEGRLFEANQAFRRMLGHSWEELRGKHFADITHADDVALDRAAFEELNQGKRESVQIEKRYVRKDGRIVWARVTVSGGRDAKCRPAFSLAMVEDVTQQKEKEQELKRSREFTKTVLEGTTDAITVIDVRDFHILGANRAFLEQFEAKEEDVLGRTCFSVTHQVKEPCSGADHVCPIQEALRTGSCAVVEHKHSANSGRISYFEVSVSPIRNENGEIASVVHVSRDITAKRRSEEARARLATAVEQAGEAIMITDADGTIQYVNPAFLSITGHEGVGQSMRVLFGGSSQDGSIYRHAASVLTRGEVWRGQLLNGKRTGESTKWEVSIAPVRDAAGLVANYVAVLRDLTQEAVLEAQLHQAQKMEAVGRLAGGVAHDFNNLLTAILGYSDIILGRADGDGSLRSDVEEIQKAAVRASALTRQLLAYSRKQVLSPKLLDLDVIVTDLDKMLRRIIGEDIELIHIPAIGLGRVQADPGQIQQVLVNLVVNARDAMPDVGKLTIETKNVDLDETHACCLEGCPPGPYVMLSVADTGCGMDAETRSHLFEPFFTTKELGKGTGLGLSTAYGIVKQSGGHIAFRSELGGGTTFRIYLPRVEVEGRADEPRQATTTGPLPSGTETILLVEDDDGVRELALQTLRGRGYAVLVARDGMEALQISGEHAGSIQLMVTDTVMPQMSGPELAERLTRLRPQMRILFMSGYPDGALKSYAALEAGRGFLQKPFTLAGLAQKVRELLQPNLE